MSRWKYSVTLAALFASTALAQSDRWEDNRIDSNFGGAIQAVIFANASGDKSVGIVFPSEECLGFDQEIYQAPEYLVNGESMSFFAQCIGLGVRIDFPATKQGLKYIINQFQSKPQVIYAQDGVQVIFQTVGFSEAYKEYGSPALDII